MAKAEEEAKTAKKDAERKKKKQQPRNYNEPFHAQIIHFSFSIYKLN